MAQPRDGATRPDDRPPAGDLSVPGGDLSESEVSDEPYSGDIEIRVHGVSGTPPEELLGRADVHQVAGDRISGFFRPSLADRMRDVPPPDTPAGAGPAQRSGPWLEGYSWGGWTSGARSRALWLVLLPFALVNVASRMLPPDAEVKAAPDGARSSRVGSKPAAGPGVVSAGSRTTPPGPTRGLRLATAGLIRILGLSLTLTLVQGAAGFAMVTVAYRCGTVPGQAGVCHGLPSWLTDLLGNLSPAARVLLTAAVPVAVVLLIWAISYQASARYEGAAGSRPAGRPDDAPMPLLRPDLWRSGPVVARLRLVHVQAGLASVAGTAAWLQPAGAGRTVALWLTAATLLAAAVLVAIRPRPPYGSVDRSRIMLPSRLLWVAVAATVAAVVVDMAPGLAAGPGPVGAATRGAADTAVARADVLVQDLFVAQALLLAVIGLAVAAGRLAGAGRDRAMFMAGFAGFFIGMLAWLLGAMLTAAVLILGPAWLARPGFAFTPRQIATALAGSDTAGWFGNTSRSAGVGMAVGVALLVVLLVQLGVRAVVAFRAGGARVDREAVDADYPGRRSAADPEVRRRARGIGFAFWIARRVDGVPSGIVLLCCGIAALLVGQGVALATSPGSPAGWAAAILGRVPPSCRAAADTGLCSHIGAVAWGAFLTAGLGVGFVLLGVLAYRTTAMRRGVGVFWDLACFWPRDTHPLAPPCYNERIMPQVSERVRWYLGTAAEPGAADVGAASSGARRGRVVLAGHSQGSVIVLAAALIQPESTRRRLALLTVGCVLDRLYSRFFPRYFGPAVYRMAASMLEGSSGSGLADNSDGGAIGSGDGAADRGAADRGGDGAADRGGAAPSTGDAGHGRWANIWRHSDYLGGAVPYPAHGVRCGPANVESIDPVFDIPPGDTVYPPAHRHSDYWTDATFLPQVHALLAATRPVGGPSGEESETLSRVAVR